MIFYTEILTFTQDKAFVNYTYPIGSNSLGQPRNSIHFLFFHVLNHCDLMLLMHQLHHFISNTFLDDNNLWLQLLQSVTQDLYQLLLLLNFTLQVLQTDFLSIFQKQ